MPLPKPSSHLDWTDGAVSKVVEPSAGKKLLGWTALERPPFEYMNFLFFRQDEWNKYTESITDEIIGAGQIIVDAGGGGQFTTLQAAHDDGNTGPGDHIVIVSDLEITATINISKSDLLIEMRPGTRIKRGGGAPADNFTAMDIQTTADRLKLMFLGFGSSTASENFDETGDLCLNLAAGANNVFMFNNQFVANVTDEVNLNGNTTVTSIGEQIGLGA